MPLKVLHLHSDVGGNAWQLAMGERAIGLESHVLTARSNWTRYPSDFELHLEKSGSQAAKLFALTNAFLRFRRNYDVFHFNFGATLLHYPKFFLNQFELPFYPAEARLFATYNGCDARQKDLTVGMNPFAPCHNSLCANGACNDGTLDAARRKGIEKMSRYVTHIWAKNPDLLNFLPAEKSSFLPYAVCIDGTPSNFGAGRKKLRILHAPTDRIIKGSNFLFAALEQLRSSHGDCYELILVEKTNYRDALRQYESADLIIDQLQIGWYGGLAVEAMLLGKPVVSWVDQKDFGFIPKEMAEDLQRSLIVANPSTLYDVLVSCVENRKHLAVVAESGYQYARRWHDPRYVASMTAAKYEEAFYT